jgi:hypothetical protein
MRALGKTVNVSLVGRGGSGEDSGLPLEMAYLMAWSLRNAFFERIDRT